MFYYSHYIHRIVIIQGHKVVHSSNLGSFQKENKKNSLQFQLGVHAAQHELNQAAEDHPAILMCPLALLRERRVITLNDFPNKLPVLPNKDWTRQYWIRGENRKSTGGNHLLCTLHQQFATNSVFFLSLFPFERVTNMYVAHFRCSLPRLGNPQRHQIKPQHSIAFPYEELFPVLLWKCTCVSVRGMLWKFVVSVV